ncbi:MAG: UPF0280 family protein [Rhodobacteraceae bacterium]|nr:UPF0280 family protein [Paracoccaceae bacterium]
MRARLQRPVSALAVPANRLGRASGGSIFEKSKPAGGGWAAAAVVLPEGRLHLQQGPIDIVAEAFGPAEAVTAAYSRAARRFATVLEELVAELPALRSEDQALQGEIAAAMAAAVAPYRPAFITPMAAVAGAVADRVVAALAGPGIARAYANNGGDIALWLTPDTTLTAALAVTGGLDRVTIRAGDGVRGIATSGWRGRSFSLGIADAVTVLAPTAAMADAAATMIANAVDLPGHDGIRRRPARDCQADSDLGDRLVTVAVAPLTAPDRACALDRGLAAAETFLARGLIAGAALYLQGEARLTRGMKEVRHD